jgi:hypothetical protein
MQPLTPQFIDSLRFRAPHLASLRGLREYQGKYKLYAAQSPEILKG